MATSVTTPSVTPGTTPASMGDDVIPGGTLAPTNLPASVPPGQNSAAGAGTGSEPLPNAGVGGAPGGEGTVGGSAGTSLPPDVADPGPALDPVGIVAAGVRWVGRVDLGDPNLPRFAWSGSGFVATVTGSTLSVQLRTDGTNDPIFFQPVIDGIAGARFSVAPGSQTVTLATGLADSAHRVEVYRETEGAFGLSVFEGFTAGTLGTPPAAPARLIEIIGDSISAGFGNLGVEQHPGGGADPTGGCAFSTETESAYLTYGAIAARALGAEASIVALSGWGVFRDNTNDPSRVLPSVYDRTLGIQPAPLWAFAQAPQVVVINLGTNDFALGDPGEAPFVQAYDALLIRVRAQYPDAWIFCSVGSLLFGSGLTSALAYHQSVVADAVARGDQRVVFLDLGQQNSALGTGCSFHPNVTEQTRLAAQLEAAIRANLGW